MRSGHTEQTPAGVPSEAQQAGEAPGDLSRWSWVQRCVWTERMLTALDTNNVKGGKAERLLCRAWAVRHAGCPCRGLSIRSAVTHRPESRVREIRTHGSEGGGTGTTGSPYPYHTRFRTDRRIHPAVLMLA